MKAEVVLNRDLKFDREKIAKHIRLDKKSFMYERLDHLCKEAENIGAPKGIYNISYVDEKGCDYVKVGEIIFESELFRENIGEINRFFPYIATSGKELTKWAESFDEIIDQFLADSIAQRACKIAQDAIFKEIDEKYGVKKTSTMNPGSLPQWPVDQQKNLFALFAGGEKKIEVELLPSSLMKPVKTVSGIRYESENDFNNCKLCPRQKCPNRSAKFERI